MLALVGAGALAARVVRDRVRARVRLQAFRDCAARRGGIVYEPAWGTGALGFEVRGAGRIVRFTERTVSTGEGLRYHTDVRLAFVPGERSDFRLRLCTRHALAGLPRLYGMAEAGPEAAGPAGPLVLQSNHPERVREVMTPRVTESLEELLGALAGSDLSVAVDGEGILVTTDRRLPDLAAVELHLDTCTELFGALLDGLGLRPAAPPTPDPDGIELLPPAASGRQAASICPVCGQALDQGPVRCRRCSTPHHPECWTYNGRCSTYGCGGRATA